MERSSKEGGRGINLNCVFHLTHEAHYIPSCQKELYISASGCWIWTHGPPSVTISRSEYVIELYLLPDVKALRDAVAYVDHHGDK